MHTRDFIIGMLLIVPFTMLFVNAWITMVIECSPPTSFYLAAVMVAFVYGVEKIERYFILRQIAEEAGREGSKNETNP